MTIGEMLGQSGILTIFGMGVVFGFLVLMIIAVTLMGKLIHSLGLDKGEEAPVKTGSAAPAQSNNAAVTAAISAAVNEYRKK